MTLDDHSAAMHLWRHTPGIGLSRADGPEAIQAYLQRNPDLSQCAWLDQTLVGTILAGHDGRRGYLHHLCVHRDFQRRGIGTLLLAHALGALATQGMDKVHAFLFTDNEAGRTFWERQGWTWRRDIGVVSRVIQTP
jgi:putative acetyltransferase